MSNEKSGTVEHWLYGKREYNILVEKETKCSDCIHVEVCDIKMEKRCSNYTMSRSCGDGCFTCVNKFSKYDSKQPIPCFHCSFFKPKDKK